MVTIPVKDPNNDHKEYQISFDIYGNIYFDGTKLSKYIYQISIDGKNMPYGERDEYKILDYIEGEDEVDTKKFKPIERSLEREVRKEGERKRYVLEDDLEENYEDEDIEAKYLQEDLDYYDDDYNDDYNEEVSEYSPYDDDNVKKYGYQNKRFDFYANGAHGIDVPVNKREDGDIAALYDTYIYKNGILCFRSHSKNNDAIYRMRIVDGKFWFRPLGSKEECYEIEIDENDNLIFKSI